MKCPRCGAWNRASLPRCFQCGAPLAEEESANQQNWKQEMGTGRQEKIYFDVDEDGNIDQTPDSGDTLAQEMESLRERRLRGYEEQRRLREAETHPYARLTNRTGRRRQNTTRRRYIITDPEEGAADTGEDRPRVSSAQIDAIDYDDYHGDQPDVQGVLADGRYIHSIYRDDTPSRTFRPQRKARLGKLIRSFVLVLLLAGGVLTGCFFLHLPPFSSAESSSLQDDVIITSSIYDDLPAHIIRIPAEEGTEIHIKELHMPGMSIGGYATFEIPDYKWYEDVTDLTDPVFHVTMTPYKRTASGEMRLMDVIHFDVDVPLSPITLVSPDVTFVEVNSRPKYQIQFKVERGSTVTINGENYSDLVSSQDGLISYNATVQPIGNNDVVIECQTKYYRKNTLVMTLYREPQDILLELDANISESWNGGVEGQMDNEMKVSGTTLNKATIRVLSDHKNLDTSQLISTGKFSFTAVFNRIGYNTISIEASYPGKKTTTVNFDVYHVPSARNYTSAAWPMDAYNYTQYLDTLNTRVKNMTIYVCKGTIVDIISDSPQRALMETGTETASRQVLLDNMSNDTWAIGDSLRVYGDAFGAYNGNPWLVGRYTYSYNPK